MSRLSARAKPTQSDGVLLSNGLVQSEISARLECLPFTKRQWHKVMDAFLMHNVICKALWNRKAYSTFLRGKAPGGELIYMFTAVMSHEFDIDHIAVSSTHYTDSKLTLTVFYGCTAGQMDHVQSLLSESPEVRDHPMLVPGLFAELQRDRLEQFVFDLELKLDDIKDGIPLRGPNIPEHERNLKWESSFQIGEFYQGAKKLEEEARTVKREFEEASRRIEHEKRLEMSKSPGDQHNQAGVDEYSTSYDRFLNRFRELRGEVDSIIVRCRLGYEELAYTRELVGALPSFL